MVDKISIKVPATPEEIAELKKLQELKQRRKTRSPMSGTTFGEYIIEKYGKKIVEEL